MPLQNHTNVSTPVSQSQAPQKIGFRKIDNELFSALIAAKLPGSVYQIVLTIINQTIGFHKDKAPISLSQFQHWTKLSKQGVVNAIQYALDREIIIREGEKGSGKVIKYSLNTDGLVNSTLLVNQSTSQHVLTGLVKSPCLQLSPLPPHTPLSPRKIYIKDKGTASFEDYKQELRERFSDLDFDIELEKFDKYWEEGTRKLQRPKLALLNWMLKARKINAEEGQHRAGRRRPCQLWERDEYHLPYESEEDYQARMKDMKKRGKDYLRRSSTKLPDTYTKPPPNPKLDRLVEQARAAR